MKITVSTAPTYPGDLFLLCSDGLSDMVDDTHIRHVISKDRNRLESTAERLIATANDDGGRDNISVVLVRVDGHSKTDVTQGAISADKIAVAALTDVGRRRAHSLVVVADGMGGCNAGEVASEMAVQVTLEELSDASTSEGSAAAGDASAINFTAINALFDDICEQESAQVDELNNDPFWSAVSEDGTPVEATKTPDTTTDEFAQAVRDMDIGQWIQLEKPPPAHNAPGSRGLAQHRAPTCSPTAKVTKCWKPPPPA